MKKTKYNFVLENILDVSIDTKYDSHAVVEILDHPEDYPLIADKIKSEFSSFVNQYQQCKSGGDQCHDCPFFDKESKPSYCKRAYYNQGSFDTQLWACEWEDELNFEASDYFSDLVYYLTDDGGCFDLYENNTFDADVLYQMVLELYKAYLKVFLIDISSKSDSEIYKIAYGVHYRCARIPWQISFGYESFEDISLADYNLDELCISSQYCVLDDENPLCLKEKRTEGLFFHTPSYKKNITDNCGKLLPQIKASIFSTLGKVDFDGLKLLQDRRVELPTKNPASGEKYECYKIVIDNNTLVFRTDYIDPALTPIRDMILSTLTDEQLKLETVQRVLQSVNLT